MPFIDPDGAGLRREWLSDEVENGNETATDMASVVSVVSVASVGSVLSVSDTAIDSGEFRAAVESTLPKRLGERNKRIFELARMLKAEPQYAEADPLALREIVRLWHRLALPVIGTKPLDDTWADFLRAWKRVRYPKGSEPMVQIAKHALSSGPPAWAIERFECPNTLRLLTLCRELHRAAKGGVWFLSCRTAGLLLGIDHTTAWSRLHLLEDEGILHATQRGNAGGKRATRYRYIGADMGIIDGTKIPQGREGAAA